ncbi:RelA/SpoT domain-containing protein, partial [Candidatus Micrarchaeota archaeon]|nr:RelA/SpoT domain-containing protein [Candidatus Micrarchaeota archaeon]
EINSAGKILIKVSHSEEEKAWAEGVLDNWRADHAYPMHIFQMTLRNYAKGIDPNALITQRLKREPAIKKKLTHSYHGHAPSMQLFQMQDIGGCRAVLSNLSQVNRLVNEKYIRGHLKHKLTQTSPRNYIQQPNAETGYRSIHLIYSFHSPDSGKSKYNGLLTEIQIRTKLQHIWATAVETAGFFTSQALKSNEGQKEWIDFFRLVSAAFAKIENTAPIPNTPTSKLELFSQIKKAESKLKVIEELTSWSDAIRSFDKEVKDIRGFRYYLLELDIKGKRLTVAGYSDEQKAVAQYDKAEKRGQENYDVVLVGADASADLKKGYPNYYADTHEFVKQLSDIISKHPNGRPDGIV